MLLKMVQYIVTLTNRVIARTGFVLRGAPGTIKIFAKTSQISVKTKKQVLPSESRAPGTVPYGKFPSGYYIIFIKKLDKALR